MTDFITVKAAKDDGKVALYEVNTEHVSKENKAGEVFIAGDGRAHKVARTPEVELRLKDGILVETDEPIAKEAESANPPPTIPEVHPSEQTVLATDNEPRTNRRKGE